MAAVGTIVVRLDPRRSPLAEVVAAAAASGPRLIDARLTGGFRYAPLADPTRAGRPAPASWRILAAAALAQERADVDPSAANLQALGSAAALAGNHQVAVRAFEDATAVEPDNASLLSDLSAAYLARAIGAGQAIDLPRAVDAADRARRRNPRLVEARFNFALALEHLHLSRQSARAWDAYLAMAPPDGWASEVQRRRDAVPVVVDPAEPPTAEAERVLRRWAIDPSAAVPDLPVAGPFHVAIADQLRRSPLAARPARAAFVVAMLEADAALARGDLDGAAAITRPFDGAAAPLDSPLGLWARRIRLTATFGSSLGRDLRGEAETLLAAAHRLGFAGLEGDALHRLGGFDYISGRYEQALERFEAAARLRASIGNHRGAASSRLVSGDAYGRLGREPEAWSAYLDVLGAGEFGDELLDQARFTSAATLAVNQGLYAAAVAVASEGLDRQRPDALPVQRVPSLLVAARAFAYAGQVAESRRVLAEAREVADRMPAAPLRDRTLAEIAFADVEANAAVDPTAAVAAAAVAERGLVASSTRQRLLALRLFEARAHRARGDVDAARRSLQAGTDLVEAQQGAIADGDFLPSFIDASWDVYAERVDLEASLGQAAAALAWLDRGYDVRRRWAVPAPPVASGSPSEAGPLVAYLARPERLWIWVVRDGAVHQRQVAVRRVDLGRAVARLSQLIEMDATAARDLQAAALAEAVWWPIAGWLTSAGDTPPRVALVLDPVLQRVPWALLPWTRGDAALVVDRTAVVVCPSVLACGSLASAHSVTVARVTALHAGQGGDGLRPLPAARAEAERVARRYDGADVDVATEARFTTAMAERTLVHFAGHAVPDERYPGRSQLLLADATGDARRIELSHVLRGPIAAEMVVLSACSTSRAEARRGQGGVGVAGEFLRAGVPFVVAAQWDVRDDAASDVMDLVHEALADHVMPWEAVRRAQRVVRQDGRRPARDWAGYVAYAAAPRP